MSTQLQSVRQTPAMSLVRGMALSTAGAVGLAVLAQINIPFLPVPASLQVLGVLLLGGLLGPRLAAAAVLEYLLLGLCGAPVFAGWKLGLATLLGPTGGYLLGFLPAAVLYGVCSDALRPARYGVRVAGLTLVGLLAVLAIYLPGWAWLTHLLATASGTTLADAAQKALVAGIAPFVLLDVAKALVAAVLLPIRSK